MCFENERDVKIFCFPLSLLIKYGVDFKITNTAQKNVQTCNFQKNEKSSQDILMLAKLHFMLLFFLIIIQPWTALKPSLLEFSFSFDSNFFCWIINIIQIFMSNLRCCAFFIRFIFALLSSFKKIWQRFLALLSHN